MIRSILFPLADNPAPASAGDYASWLARPEGCAVHALAVIDIKAFEIPVLGTPDGFMPAVVAPPVQESQNLLEQLTAAARGHLEQWTRQCATRGVQCSTEIRTGIPSDVFARESAAHDLVVMARTGYIRPTGASAHIEPLVMQVIRGSIRPVLVAGRQFPTAGEVRALLVAFDGSPHAARVLPVAAWIAARPGIRCTLAAVSSSEGEGQAILAPAEAFLNHHGVVPAKKVVVSSRPSDAICDLVSSIGADMLVMGAYGHSPIRGVFFGSTTEHVLKQCGCTVLLQS